MNNLKKQLVPFELISIGEIPSAVLDSYEDLLPDSYLKGEFIFRNRAFSNGDFLNGEFKWKEHYLFEQSRILNKYAGGLKRDFMPISDVIKSFVENLLFKQTFASVIPNADYHVGVHQIRTLCNDKHMGYPAPEGIHQDGFDYIAVLSINRVNLSGGITCLFDIAKEDEIVFEGIMDGGNALVLDDVNLKHYTSPITPKIPNLTTYRDVIVITYETIKN